MLEEINGKKGPASIDRTFFAAVHWQTDQDDNTVFIPR